MNVGAAAQKVALFRWTAGLGPERPIYAITYSQDGQETGRGFARGDELEEWRKDLEADGWRVIIQEQDPEATP